jgi:DNA-binding transcriptional regulator YdaS (Cro superfamily)
MNKALLRALARADMSQAEFAKSLKVSPGLVWQWLNGVRPVSPEKILPICRVLEGHITPADLNSEMYPPALSRAFVSQQRSA